MGRNESPEEDVVAALPSMKDVYNRLREARSTVDSLEKAMGKAAQAALGRIKQLQEELAEARSSEKDDIERMRKKHEREVKDARVDAAALMKRLAEVRRETEAELEAENDRRKRLEKRHEEENSSLKATIEKLRSQLRNKEASEDGKDADSEEAPKGGDDRSRSRKGGKRKSEDDASVATDIEAEDKSESPLRKKRAGTKTAKSRSASGSSSSSSTAGVLARPARKAGAASESTRSTEKGKAAGKGKGGKPNICMPHILGKCSKGDNCPSMHLAKEAGERLVSSMRKKPCKDGDKCQKADCIFMHPPERKLPGAEQPRSGRSRSRSRSGSRSR
eukprot:TRINITY_DN17211_c0_g1_i1.p1 TRINITY_DN17211_c0_g1~~TRINITY_DN17211_c0_g1_i1.p1  ORF type:complete len:333 (+),score=100.89 TRINITY_DN17211_c0_g1_i1:79-1077(+)